MTQPAKPRYSNGCWKSQSTWVPKLDDADRCANCECPWDMHAAGRDWHCPRVTEGSTNAKAVDHG